MKTNAIVRIILFSLAIVILSGILLAGLGFDDYRFDDHVSASIEEGMYMTAGGVQSMNIRELEIEWVAGDIELVAVQNDSQIRFSESGVTDPDDQLVYNVDGDTLSIRFCKDSMKFPSFGINVDVSKDLTITVPQDWLCKNLDIDAASANLTVRNLTIDEVDFDGASGLCVFEDCIIKEMNMDTASGDIRFLGNLDHLEVDAASASCVIEVKNVPKQIDLNTMSGDLELTLPEYCGFTVSMDAMSSDFSSDFPTTMQNGNYIYGDGSCSISIDAMSGDVAIRKGVEAAFAADCTDAICTIVSHKHAWGNCTDTGCTEISHNHLWNTCIVENCTEISHHHHRNSYK